MEKKTSVFKKMSFITAGYGFTGKCEVDFSKEKPNIAPHPTPYSS